jgi:hypothetical protein
MKFTKTGKFFKALRDRIWNAEDTRKANIDNRYSAEIFPSVAEKLEAAAEALRRIECLTNDHKGLFPHEIIEAFESAHKLAQDGRRAAIK